MHASYSLTLFLILIGSPLFSQNYFVDQISIKSSDASFICTTNDGGWLVAYSIINDENAAGTDGIQVVKYNLCQEIDWTKEYLFGGMPINVDGLLCHSSGAVFLCGLVEGDNDSEDLFLLRLNTDGTPSFFKVYRKPFRELVYTIDETPSGDLMLFGISYENSNSSRNIFLTIDVQGNLLQATAHGEAGIWGYGKACSDGGYIGRTGNRIFKVDEQGNPLWANNYPMASNCTAPVEIEGGYVFCTNPYPNIGNERHFLFKLNYEGAVEWVSPGYTAFSFSTLALNDDGNILCMDYYLDSMSNDYETSLLEFSTTGEILSVSNMVTEDLTGLTRSIKFSVHPDGSVVFSMLKLASQLLFVGKSDESLHFTCGATNLIFTDSTPLMNYDNYVLPNNSITFNIENYELTYFEASNNLERLCGENNPDTPTLTADTTICQGETLWLRVNALGAEFQWQDGSTSDSLLVASAGTYSVTITLCDQTIVLQSTVQIAECPCQVVAPNAFTPDGDGQNDVFRILSDCTLSDFKLQIYSRWGQLVYESSEAGAGWNGLQNGANAPMDVYLYRCVYRKDDTLGDELLKLEGNLTLIR